MDLFVSTSAIWSLRNVLFLVFWFVLSIKVQDLVCYPPFIPFALLPFTPAVCHSQKYESGTISESRTAAKNCWQQCLKLMRKLSPSRATERWRECKMGKKDDGDGADLLIRWAWGGPEDRIPSLLPRLKFCAWEVFNFLKSQLHSVGSVLFSLLPTGLVPALTPRPQAVWGGGLAFGGWGRGGGGINRMAACLFDRGEAKLGEREWGWDSESYRYLSRNYPWHLGSQAATFKHMI